jgi:murein DD-endopeptidase MepM/ murein hydrolase activator NlpD
MRWVWIPLAGVAVAAVAAVVVTDATGDVTGQPSQPPAPIAACAGFDYPVGPPDASGYYDAQPFGANDHLGNDWNGNDGGDSDLGDPVHAIAAGVVSVATDHGGGWGNVVRVVHACSEVPGHKVESLYAHLDTIEVHAGQRLGRGQRLGTIGTAGGQYRAHLHLELRARPAMPLGGGYSKDTTGYLDPSAFILRHR